MEVVMVQLTNTTKAKKVTDAMFKLATEYAISNKKDDVVLSKKVVDACLSMSEHSKARLFDILTVSQN